MSKRISRKGRRKRKRSKADEHQLKKKIDIIRELKDSRLKVESKYKRLWDLMIFLLKFNIFLIPIYLISYYRLNLIPLQLLVAQSVAGLLRMFHIPFSIYGIFIKVLIPEGSFGAFITWDCTGWKSIMAFLALIYATPATVEKKILAIALTPFIFFVNILRILFMFWFVHSYGTENFNFIHHTLWSYGMIFTIFVLWVIWYKDSINYDKKIKTLKKN